MVRHLVLPFFLLGVVFTCAHGQAPQPIKPESAPRNSPRPALKPVGPPAVDVEAQRLESGKLQITFTYYQGTGKLERVKCSGSITDIETAVRVLGKQNRMPSRVQDLVEVALRHIRVLDVPAKN